MTAPPTFQEEIDRKTLTAMESLLGELESGLISSAMYQRALDALWEVSAGLVSRDVIHLFEQMPRFKAAGNESFMQFSIAGEHLLVLDDCELRIHKIFPMPIRTALKPTPALAHETFKTLKEKLQ